MLRFFNIVAADISEFYVNYFKFNVSYFKFNVSYFKFNVNYFKFNVSYFKFNVNYFKFNVGYFKLSYFKFNESISNLMWARQDSFLLFNVLVMSSLPCPLLCPVK